VRPVTSRASPPLPLRLWTATRRALPARVREPVGHRLAARLARPGRPVLGAEGVALRIDPQDRFQRAMLLGLYDPVIPAIIERHVRPGDHVLDCGAHIGYLALLFARAVGPRGAVHCFEPDPRVAERLRANVAANATPWVHVTEAAVVDRPGRTLDLALTDQLGWGSVAVDVWGSSAHVRVAGVTVDDHVREHGLRPAFVKLDVEGAEADALRGMTRTLEQDGPALLVEWIPWRIEANGDDPAEILARLDGLGYAPHVPALRRGRLDLSPGTVPAQGEDLLFLRR
jgi:FkbM family methyltransferase